VKLTARTTLSQMIDCGRAASLIQHQFVELATSHFTNIFSHNFITYK